MNYLIQTKKALLVVILFSRFIPVQIDETYTNFVKLAHGPPAVKMVRQGSDLRWCVSVSQGFVTILLKNLDGRSYYSIYQ